MCVWHNGRGNGKSLMVVLDRKVGFTACSIPLYPAHDNNFLHFTKLVCKEIMCMARYLRNQQITGGKGSYMLEDHLS